MSVKLPLFYEPTRATAKLRELLFTMIKELGKVPERIVVALGPYRAEHSITIWKATLARGNQRVSRRELAGLFQNLFTEHRDPQHALLAHPLGILANRYAVTPQELERAVVGELGFRTLLLSLPAEIGVALSDMKQSLGGMPIELVAPVLAYKEAVTRSLGVKDAFLVDVGGEDTILTLLKDTEIVHVATLAIGSRHFLRGLSKILSLPLEEAEYFKRQYTQGLVSPEKKKEIAAFFTEESRLWEHEFRRALDSFYYVGPIPQQVFLFGGGAHLPEVGAVLRNPEWMKSISPADSPQVKILEASALFGGSTLSGFLQGPEEVGLAALIIYSLHHQPLF